ncbi:MAG: cellulose synthase operon protein YhjQ [Proteobacteria bacterium]|jgi:cellulose synthase operon protein YhjQ|nr:cellulose synthase operon protein YhjQ [Pseudomonadota bacterium]
MHIISFVSGKGGSGKTTLTANVAVALARRGHSVVAIDLDPQNALGLHLGLEATEEGGLAREGIRRSAMFESPFGVHFIPFGRLTTEELPEFHAFLRDHPDWLAQSLAALPRSEFRFVLLDTPPGPTPYLRQALHAAHRVLVCGLADAASYATLPQMMALVEEYTHDRPQFLGAHPIINQMPVNGRLGHQVRSAVATEYGATLAPVSVHRDPRVAHALASEQPVVEYDPAAMASLDIEYLADWLIDLADL